MYQDWSPQVLSCCFVNNIVVGVFYSRLTRHPFIVKSDKLKI